MTQEAMGLSQAVAKLAEATEKQKPESPASLTIKVDYRGYDTMFTLRDETGVALLEKFDRVIDKLESLGAKPQGAPNTELTFEAEEIVSTMHDGTVYWKVKGGVYTKFGVTIWPEVLQESGFDYDQMDPRETYDINGRKAVCQLNEEGKPKKVVKLL